MKLAKDKQIRLINTHWDEGMKLYIIGGNDRELLYEGAVEYIDLPPFCYYDLNSTEYFYITEENNIYHIDMDYDYMISPIENYIHEQEQLNEPIELEQVINILIL